MTKTKNLSIGILLSYTKISKKSESEKSVFSNSLFLDIFSTVFNINLINKDIA